MNIVPVSKEKVDEAINLLNRVFPLGINRHTNPETSLKCSLYPEEYKEYYDSVKLLKTTPYVLIEDGKIVGVTGIYHRRVDGPNTAWLGWFCIAPEYRRKGLGRKLLEWTMDKAREEGVKTFKLYTSDDPELDASQVLYDKLGFVETGREPGEGETLIYKQVQL